MAWSKRSAARAAAIRSQVAASARSPPSRAWSATTAGSASGRPASTRPASRCSSARRPAVVPMTSASRTSSWRNRCRPASSTRRPRCSAELDVREHVQGAPVEDGGEHLHVEVAEDGGRAHQVAGGAELVAPRTTRAATSDGGSSPAGTAASSERKSGWPPERS